FDHLRRQVTGGKRDVRAFCYLRHEVPDYMTRMLAVAQTAGPDVPLLLMDTAEASVIGAMDDPHVAAQHCKVVANLGNEHTLAFHLHGSTIQGLFEHHTHTLGAGKLESYLRRLTRGGLEDEEVWMGQGHGAIILEAGEEIGFLSVTGPLRGMLEASPLNPYFATPHGDMMLAGCFGLVRALAERCEPWREEILRALRASDGAMWDLGHHN
ncbi:MAG: hypothetical protein HY531_04045, partial [Chloroflexi bacterium]|nr:hypothetical protein [Chloroflexota bacterium]